MLEAQYGNGFLSHLTVAWWKGVCKLNGNDCSTRLSLSSSPKLDLAVKFT